MGILAESAKMPITEDSHSGRVHHLGKVARGKPLRGFESLIFRQKTRAASANEKECYNIFMYFSLKKITLIVTFGVIGFIVWQIVTPFFGSLNQDVLSKRISIETISNNPRPISVAFGTTTLSIEFAVTDSERDQGLGDRFFLEEGKGMLFIFEKNDRYGIWMKDMLFPIDIAWLDSKYRIIDIERNVSPSTYPESFFPDTPARYVLEVNAGFFEKNGISTGARLILLEEDDPL